MLKCSLLPQELLSLPRYHCLLLTGTPLQNRTEELWALLHFCDRDRFADQSSFMDKFGDLKDAEQVKKLCCRAGGRLSCWKREFS